MAAAALLSWASLAVAASSAGASGKVGNAYEEPDLESCARLLGEGALPGDWRTCRILLLGALHSDEIPGYAYNETADCLFWAHYAARDRSVEFSRITDFNRLAAFRLSEPFDPPLRRNGTALYIGAHRAAEDGVLLQQRHGLHVHLFEPSPSFFRNLQDAVGNRQGFTLHNYGLGLSTRWAKLRLSEDASRTLDAEATHEAMTDDIVEHVLIRSTEEVIGDVFGLPAPSVANARAENGAVVGDHCVGGGSPDVELLHINCEGCEYDVLQGLSDTGLLAGIAQVQVATHLLERPAASLQESFTLSLQASAVRYCGMHRVLSETHSRVWGLPWVWERWTRRQT